MSKISDLAKAFEKNTDEFTQSSKKTVNNAYNQIDQYSKSRSKESENTIGKDMQSLESLVSSHTAKIMKVFTSKILGMILGAVIFTVLLTASLQGLISHQSDELTTLYKTIERENIRLSSIQEAIAREGKKTNGVGVITENGETYITIPAKKKIRGLEASEEMNIYEVIGEES